MYKLSGNTDAVIAFIYDFILTYFSGLVKVSKSLFKAHTKAKNI